MFGRGGDLSDAVLRAMAHDEVAPTQAPAGASVGDSEVIARARAKEKELLEMYERTKIRADFSVAVPTNDLDVKKKLRECGQPICLFGEDAFDRRQRLKLVLAKGTHEITHEATQKPIAHETQQSTFYTHGTAGLLEARKKIAHTSLECAKIRLKNRDDISPDLTSYWGSEGIVSYSQIADKRPLSSISFDSTGANLAVASWSGDISIFNAERLVGTLRGGHTDRCASVVWNTFDNSVELASGGADAKVCLWSRESLLGGLEGHELRVNRIAFHPRNENLLVSTSDDETWRLWDIERREELLLQEGHVSGVFAVAFHPDGSLVATSDTCGVIRAWDLRSGRCIMGFEGHVEQVVSLTFSENGYTLASSSGDNSVRIWDLRKRKCADILTGHEKLVSTVKFCKNVLLTSGYDCVARVWDTRNFCTIKTLPIHESRIMAADISPDGKSVATACYDRSFKVWTRERAQKDEEMKLE